MSAGAFNIVGYIATYDDTQIHPIRVQPETLALVVNVGTGTVTNTATTGDINNPMSARVSGGRRSLGLHARLIRVKFSGTPPTGYLAGSTISLPVLNPAILGVNKGATGTYLGASIVVVGTTPEKLN